MIGAGLVVVIAGVVGLVARPAALPTIAALQMPVPRSPLDGTLTIGSTPGVSVRSGTRLEIDSRHGQFRGHWWWNKGWVYVSGSVLPGSRIHVHIDSGSLSISETPDANAVAQLRRYGRKIIYIDEIQVDIVRFGIGATLIATRTPGGPFAGRHVVDQLEARVWSTRGLTITRDRIASRPADVIPCMPTQQPFSGWSWGCRLLGQPPLIS